jgi:hypothetical protein
MLARTMSSAAATAVGSAMPNCSRLSCTISRSTASQRRS